MTATWTAVEFEAQANGCVLNVYRFGDGWYWRGIAPDGRPHSQRAEIHETSESAMAAAVAWSEAHATGGRTL